MRLGELLRNQKSSHMKEERKLYRCPECKLWYKDEEWAEKCEAWCKKHHTCNVEIITHAENSNSSEKL